jgi:hypothetical protein
MKFKCTRKTILEYPSGSALEFYKDNLYVVGDDINYILCLDKQWNEINKIKLFDYDGIRIPKPEKPDLECAAIVDDILYVVGSGSKSPQRDVAFIINLTENKVKKISTAAFYSIFKDRNLINEMNIEGFTGCKDKLLFFNRGNTLQPNLLIITDQKVLKKQFPDKFKVIPVVLGKLHDFDMGISGACYDVINDILFLSASAENTSNAYDDGEIMGSAIAIVYDAYKKLNNKELVIDELIDLNKTDDLFLKQKIESVCLTDHSGNHFSFVLVADNDDGKSVLFELQMEL